MKDSCVRFLITGFSSDTACTNALAGNIHAVGVFLLFLW